MERCRRLWRGSFFRSFNLGGFFILVNVLLIVRDLKKIWEMVMDFLMLGVFLARGNGYKVISLWFIVSCILF